MLWRIAWRGLGRNRRRAWLTGGAIAFSVLILAFFMSLQTNSYRTMIDNATQLTAGHVQIQRPDYLDNPRQRATVGGVAALLTRLRREPEVVGAFPRAIAFALVSHGERCFGAQVQGVQPDAERRYSSIWQYIEPGGRFLQADNANEAIVGALLARNLGARRGDELVIIGTSNQGSVAALAVRVVGTVNSGIAELDRTLLQLPLTAFRSAFELHDEASVVVVMAANPARGRELAAQLQPLVAPNVARAWPQLMPELEQAIAVDRASGYVLYVLLGIMVVFSIVNTFIMTVFERTREMGMLMAVGMTPGQLQGMLQLEALMLCGLGVIAGVALAWGVLTITGFVGLPLGDQGDAVLRGFHMPSHLYPRPGWRDLLVPSAMLLVATQIAAFLPTLKIRRLLPVEALRAV